MYHLLICDDDPEIINVLKLYFETDNYQIFEAHHGLEAMTILKQQPIDLVIIDIMMPHMDGYEVIKQAKQVFEIPFLIISAKVSLDERLLGYQIGADDYITKPFEPQEVVAKVEARLNRLTKRLHTLELGDVVLDRNQKNVALGQTVHELTAVEFAVLEMLMESPQRVFTKAQLYERGWQEEYLADDNSLRVIINRLREKIGTDHIQTIRGIGYRYQL